MSVGGWEEDQQSNKKHVHAQPAMADGLAEGPEEGEIHSNTSLVHARPAVAERLRVGLRGRLGGGDGTRAA